MKVEIQILKQRAIIAKNKFHLGIFTEKEAKNEVSPYLLQINKAANTFAKEYGCEFKKLSFESYVGIK